MEHAILGKKSARDEHNGGNGERRASKFVARSEFLRTYNLVATRQRVNGTLTKLRLDTRESVVKPRSSMIFSAVSESFDVVFTEDIWKNWNDFERKAKTTNAKRSVDCL